MSRLWWVLGVAVAALVLWPRRASAAPAGFAATDGGGGVVLVPIPRAPVFAPPILPGPVFRPSPVNTSAPTVGYPSGFPVTPILYPVTRTPIFQPTPTHTRSPSVPTRSAGAEFSLDTELVMF